MIRACNTLASFCWFLSRTFERLGVMLSRCPNCGRSPYNSPPCVGGAPMFTP